MSEPLKRCPWCGSVEPLKARKFSAIHEVKGACITCYDCGADGPWANTVEEARDAWNRRAPADDLLRELRDAAQHVLDCDMAEQEWDAERLRTAVARADAHLAGREPQTPTEAGAELLNAISIVALLKLARGRMQHIVETTAAAMTSAEVHMTRDLITQIDAAFDHPDPEPPKEDGR